MRQLRHDRGAEDEIGSDRLRRCPEAGDQRGEARSPERRPTIAEQVRVGEWILSLLGVGTLSIGRAQLGHDLTLELLNRRTTVVEVFVGKSHVVEMKPSTA